MFWQRLLLIFLLHAAGISAQQWPSNNNIYKLVQTVRHIDEAALSQVEKDWNDLSSIKDLLTPEHILEQSRYSLLNVSDVCTNQTVFLLESLAKKSKWALELVDAWGKPNAGIFNLALMWVGSYEECLSVESNITGVNISLVTPSKFEGQYCDIGAPVGSTFSGLIGSAGLTVGGCFPSGCSEQDIHELVNYVLRSNHAFNVGCHEEQLPLSNGAIATIVLYSVVGALCLLATLYDLWFILTEPSEEEDDVTESLSSSDGQRSTDDDVEILIPPSNTAVKREHSRLGQFLMCFSLYTNGCKLLNTSQPPGSLRPIHGIRFISMTWVVLGHTLVFSLASVGNLRTVFSWMKRWTFQVILNGSVCVDSFFVIGALLTSYLLLNDWDKKKPRHVKFLLSVPIKYLHRYIRLTPAYGFMLLFYACLMLYMFNGPLKQPHVTIGDVNCQDYWWANLLYVNNVVEPLKECAPWSWYLSNDFQFYLISPFVVYLMHRLPKVGFGVSVALVVISSSTATGLSVKDNLGITTFLPRDPATRDLEELKHVTEDYYYAPWSRYQSYGVGLTFGFILWHCKGKLPISRAVNLLLWALCGAAMLAVIYGPIHMEDGTRVPSVAETSFYNGWARIGWSVALGYIILACCTGRGGWVNEFLSWPGFVPLSRMTYCAYLIHPVIITILSTGHQNKVFWDDLTYINLFAGYLTLSYAVAFLFSLMFEAPFMHIDKKYLTGRIKG